MTLEHSLVRTWSSGPTRWLGWLECRPDSQGCGPGPIQEASIECINKWDDESVFLFLPFPSSLSLSNQKIKIKQKKTLEFASLFSIVDALEIICQHIHAPHYGGRGRWRKSKVLCLKHSNANYKWFLYYLWHSLLKMGKFELMTFIHEMM